MPHKRIFIKPAAGLLVRDPLTREPLPEAGDWKPLTSYWRRRLDDQDVLKAKTPAAPKSAADHKEP